MNKFFSTAMSLAVASVLAVSLGTEGFAQTKPAIDGQVDTRIITLEKDGQDPVTLTLTGNDRRLIDAATIAGVLYGQGVDVGGLEVASKLILAGADQESVANLALAMQGMLSQGGELDVNRFSSAINAYNAIIDKADAATIQSLQQTQEFMDIGELLKAIREPIG